MQNLGWLRSFLNLDRISVCKLQSNSDIQVIAETVRDDSLPPLLSSCLSLKDILPLPYEKIFQSRMGAMINVERKTVFQIPPIHLDTPSVRLDRFTYLAEESPVLNNLKKLGVNFSCILPIFNQDAPWGLLMAQNIEATFLSSHKLETMGIVMNELSLRLVQEAQKREDQIKAEHENVLTQVTALLQSSPNPSLQDALKATVIAFQGTGGRLCVRKQNRDDSLPFGKDLTKCLAASSSMVNVYTCGLQPSLGTEADVALIEHYHRWQHQYASGNHQVWVIANLYETPELEPIFKVFKSTSIQSFVLIPFVYRQQLLGYLCVFRDFVTESGQKLSQEQKRSNIELAQRLGQQFSRIIYEWELSQQVESSSTRLSTELQQKSTQLKQVTKQQESLAEMLAEIQTSNDLEVTLKSATRALCLALEAERVAVYRFNADWGGAFIHDLGYSVPKWIRAFKLGSNTVWNDTYLQDTEGGRFRYNESLIVENVHKADLTSCHVDIYDQFSIKAFATAPVFIDKRLWGILSAYQHSCPRHWESTDVQFLTQTASALGLALQRAELINVSSGNGLRYPKLLGKINTSPEQEN